MNTNETKKSTSLRIHKGLYTYVEKQAKKEHRSVNNYLEKLIKEALNYKEPNEQTKQAIKEAQVEKQSLKRYDNTEDLMKDLMKD